MFKVESYISPFLLGYIDKYVKLKQEDFQLSLWGGDAVLNKLDLRLDVIEGALQLPITFKSGHIHELRLHVPWTKLGSEPVVITINTIECVLKLRDSAYNDTASTKSETSTQAKPAQPKPKPNKQAQDTEDLPPGYLQSLMHRIINNVNIVVNNLILKFVEDDIVLSVNVKSAECYSVNRDWLRSFIELSMPELVLRRIVDFHDLTICLDKRNASGKIESYQDPLLYRCSLTCRLHMIYDTLHSKLPASTKFNILCEKLDLSLTDTQVPMFFRLIELCVALYYGTLEPPGGESVADDEDVGADAIMVNAPQSPGVEAQVGWAAWAWSYVPAILPSGEYEDDEDLLDDYVGVPKKQERAILAIGVYISKATIVFKLSEYSRDTPYQSGQKVQFRPCLIWECDAIGLEALMRGISFIDVQLGISGTKISGLGDAICGIKDFESGHRDPAFLRAGLQLETMTKHPHYHLSQSLFDPGSAENLGDRPTFVFDPEKHLLRYTEQYALQKYGAFWMDYLFTMEESEANQLDRPGGSRSSHSNHSLTDEHSQRENSQMRFMLGPAQLNVCSSMVQRVHKFIHCMKQCDYEPYSQAKPFVVEEHGTPNDKEVKRLEEFIPTRSYNFSMIQPTVCLMAADLPEYDLNKRKLTTKKPKKTIKSKASDDPTTLLSALPTVVLQAERFDLQVTSSMYPKAVVKVVSKLPAPSSNLMHYCHSHMNIKLTGLQAGLTAIDPGRGMFPLQSILQPANAVYNKTALLLPIYWKNPLQPHVEHDYELPLLTVDVTKAQILLITQLVLSWQQTNPSPSIVDQYSLMDDIFKAKYVGQQPILELGISGLEVKYCDTEVAINVSGALGTLQALVLHTEQGFSHLTPILYGPVNTSNIHNMELFTNVAGNKQDAEITQDLVTFTVQFPKNPSVPQAPAAVLVEVLGAAICWDPLIHDWMNYAPVVKATSNMATVAEQPVIDSNLLVASLPLKRGSETLSESTVTNPTDSQTRTQTQTSQPLAPVQVLPPGGPDTSHTEKQAEPAISWGERLSGYYPLIKMLHLQFEMKNWVVFLPEHRIQLCDPSMNIPDNMRTAMADGVLSDVLVLSLPSASVHCTAQRSVPTRQSIPIKSMEQSLAGEKLPWSVKLEDFAVYTIDPLAKLLGVVHPASMSATVAVSTKYMSPLSDVISSLGLCVHADITAITVKLSKSQISLTLNLLLSYMAFLTKLMESAGTIRELHSKGFKSAIPSDVITPAAAPEPAVVIPLPPGGHSSIPGFPDRGELGLATITETSDTLSRGEPSPHSEVSEGVKLSLWIQWTLLKFVVKFYMYDNMDKELLLRADLEDLTSALDVQDVFSKLKCKIGSFMVQHYIKRVATWEKGSYKGILLSSSDQITRNIPIATNKTWFGRSTPASHMFYHDDTKQPDKSLGFVTLTFTRAQQKNVQKRLRNLQYPEKAKIDENYDDDDGDKKTKKVLYMNEICLNVQPFDVILNCPVIRLALDIADVIDLGKLGAVTPPMNTESSQLPLFTSSKLPLMYVNMGHIRCIIPNCMQPKDDLQNSSDRIQVTPESSIGNLSVSVTDMDMLMMQVAEISIRPHADNPLPRNIVNAAIYQHALRARLTHQPGSDVEDRQYQIDIHGLSLCSGSWGELVSLTDTVMSAQKDPSVQNPALEWNTLRTNADGEVEEVRLIPVASSFDLRLVAVPAIVYTPPDSHRAEAVVVCGYSLEVNVTTDMDFCVSAHQVHLLHQIYLHNICSMAPPTNSAPGIHQMSLFITRDPELSMDSGIESEASTSIQLRPKKLAPAPKPTADPKKPIDWSNITPFDVLLTAGKISFILYSVEERKPEIKVVDVSTGNGDLATMKTLNIPLILPLIGGSSDSPGLPPKSPNLTSRRVKPFLYAYFSQPHSLISFHQDVKKAELSCYDIILKGTQDDYFVPDAYRVIPEPVDFMMHWIETRPGRSDPKTGIPPSLYTLRVSDILHGPAKIDLCIDRPLKVNLSSNKLEQAIAYWKTLTQGIMPGLTPSERLGPKARVFTEDEPHPPEALTTLTFVSDLNLHMDQVVVVMDMTLDKVNCGLQVAVTGLNSSVNLLKYNKAYIQEIQCVNSFRDLTVKTCHMGRRQPLIGPLQAQVTVGLQWLPHSGSISLPQTIVFVECGLVPIQFGQEHLLAIEALVDGFQTCMKKFHGIDKKNDTIISSYQGPSGPKVIHQLPVPDRSTDDLRTGRFEFVSDDMGMDLLPAANEVVFGVDMELGQATMTWCYPCPRVVTSLKVTPVPFTLPLQVEAIYVDEDFRVPCVLQFWNVLSRRFDNYCEFSLSENEHTDVRLPEITADFNPDLAISGIWRVLVLHPDGHRPQLRTDDKTLEPLISPMSLAASVCVDSVFIRTYIAALQLSATSTLLQLHLVNHLTCLSQIPPAMIHPFHLDEGMSSDHEYAVISLDHPHIAVTNIQGNQKRWDINAGGSLQCDVLEYRNLTLQPLLDPVGVNIEVNWLQGKEWEKLQADVIVDELSLRVSQGAVHTLSTAALSWKQLHQLEAEAIIPHYYIICNDTQETIRFGQIDSDESVILKSREAHPYSWRSHKLKQLLQVSAESIGWLWSDPVCIDTVGTVTRTIDATNHSATLIICVKQITNCQKQITISGQVIIASRLSRQLDVRILANTITKETTSSLKPMETLPSYVIEHDQIRAFKVKLEGAKIPWSPEIPINSDKGKESRLIKLPLHDKKGYIHIWCHIFIQEHKRTTQNIIVLTPLFVVRTQMPHPLLMNLTTPRLKQHHQVALDGRGADQQLHMLGGDVTHNLTFQLSPTMKPSSPAVTLSSGMIDQVDCQAVDKPNAEDLMYTWRKVQGPTWPYNNTQIDSSLLHDLTVHSQDVIISENSHPITSHTTTLPRGQKYPTHQPNIDLQINLSQLWAGCNTLLIDVVPYWLMANQSGMDLVLIGQERGQEKKQWKITNGQMFAPPVMEGPFCLGVMWGYMLHQSDAITLSKEDHRSRYLPNAPNLLYLHGNLCVTIPLVKDGMVNKICYLTLDSTMQHGMRVLTTRERYCLVNKTTSPLDCLCLSLILSMNKIDIHGEKFGTAVIGCPDDSANKVKDKQQSTNHELSLLLWDVPMSESSLDDFLQPSGKLVEHVQYIAFRQHSEKDVDLNHLMWSFPVRLKTADQGRRQTLALPQPPDVSIGISQATKAVTVATQIRENITYIVLMDDPDPPIVLHNNCSQSFYVGQTLAAAGIPGAVVQEEAELTASLPLLPAHSMYHYAFPSANTQFPAINKNISTWKLHFASTSSKNMDILKADDTEKGQGHRKWSSGVDLGSLHDTFISIPEAIDVKVHSEHIGHTFHVYVDPVNRAEISAKEIRSRITGHDIIVVQSGSNTQKGLHTADGPGLTSPIEDISPLSSGSASPIKSPRYSAKTQESHRRIQPILEAHANVLFQNVSIRLVDQTAQHYYELMRISASDIIVAMTPEDVTKALTSRQTHYMQRLMCGVRDIQIDNQVYGKGSYDFPVIFVPQDQTRKDSQDALEMDRFLKLAKYDKWKEIKRRCMIYATLQLSNNVQDKGINLTRLSLAAQPVQLFIEDVFLYNLVKYIDQLIPTMLFRNLAVVKMPNSRVPRDILPLAASLNQPIRFHRLSIEPVSFLISVHASLKLFIASDNTPLKFTQYERQNILTNSSQLIRSLAMHYASGALFRAGWVVGSLEILGSPTGLLRSVGNGVADMFRMPYEGLSRGPGAFVGGVTRGMGSLLKHISTGTLTSITNFASSVSRNMDRLSLDHEHWERQEEGRRHKPAGLSQGLKNGFSGLGICLLGAIAGIADQPLQTFAPPLDPDDLRTTSQAATCFVSGVGKGLVGIVTKPIGGAAELVSQTGMGLLHGTGLSQFPAQRHQAVDEHFSVFPNGLVKYLEKLLESGPKSEIIFAVMATQLAPDLCTDQMALVLTADVLYMMSENQDVMLQAFTLSEIHSTEDEWDPHVIRLIVKDAKLSVRGISDRVSNTDRVAEFIDKAAQYAPITSQDSGQDDQSDQAKKNDNGSSQSENLKKSDQSESPIHKLRRKREEIGPFEFQLDMRQREIFLAIFNILSDRVNGYGFAI